jgi:hypothetical protein
MAKSLRVLLACLAFAIAFPAASTADVGTRPVAAAFAQPSVAAARLAKVALAVVPAHVVARAPLPVPTATCAQRSTAARPSEPLAPDRRRLYLENRSLLC